MKAVRLTMDEKLLARLDADRDVKRLGRSAVFRRLAAEYLDRPRRSAIADQYRGAYGNGVGLPDEFTGWEDEGA